MRKRDFKGFSSFRNHNFPFHLLRICFWVGFFLFLFFFWLVGFGLFFESKERKEETLSQGNNPNLK